MRKYKKKEITKIEETEIGITCDMCKKEILNEEDYKSEFRTKMSHYYEITTHHNDWENDSIDSYEYRDICSENCLFNFLKDYYDGTDGTLCCEIEEHRI